MHSIQKMRYYGLSEARIKRVINNPKRKELGIAPGTIAVMQPTGSKKHPTEIWLMYQTIKSKAMPIGRQVKSMPRTETKFLVRGQKLKVISVWRYPGKSPIHGPIPIPSEILEELGEITNN